MNMDGQNAGAPENFPPPPQESQITEEKSKVKHVFSWVRSLLVLVFLIIVVVASFRISFYLGQKMLFPAKRSPDKIVVPVPEPPASIKALQRLQEVMSGEVKTKPCPAKAVRQPVRTNRTEKPARHWAPRRSGYYKVEAAVYADKGTAAELASKIAAKGFSVFVKKVAGGWRVQVGAYKTRSGAEAQQRQLSGQSIQARIIFE